MSDYLDKPVFITGFNKSGTTLLLSLLDDHAELVVVPEELHFFNNVLFADNKLEMLKRQTGFRIFLSNDHLKDWSQGKSWLKDGYPEFNMTEFNSLLDSSIRGDDSAKSVLLKSVDAFARADGVDTSSKRRWACKTTQEERYNPLLDRMFKRSNTTIYVVRDPRDVYASIKKREGILTDGEGVQGSLENFMVAWGTQVKQAIEYNIRDNFRIVRFEDIIYDVESMLNELSGWLGISQAGSMYQPTRHGKPWGGNSVYAENFKGLSREPIGRYKSALSDVEIDILQQALSEQMKTLGYDNDEIQQSSVVPARFGSMRFKYRLRYKLKQMVMIGRYLLTA